MSDLSKPPAQGSEPARRGPAPGGAGGSGAARPVPSRPTTPRNDRPFSTKQIVAAVLAVLAIVFLVENTDDATVRLLIPVVHIPMFAVILICLLVGSLVTFLLTWRRQRGAKPKK